MTSYRAVLVDVDDDQRRELTVDAPTFGSALETITTEHIPDGWRVESVEVVTGRLAC